MDDTSIILSRYEVARIIGMRAMQLDEGSLPLISVLENDNSLSLASRELGERKLDVIVKRGDLYHRVRDARFPKDLDVLLMTMKESL
jgi:DNA-directed RNA polymerase subunit K/omega